MQWRALLVLIVPLLASGCRVTSADTCSSSCECETLGKCGAKGQICVPKQKADCASSLACKETGACSLKDDKCVADSDADCEGSKLCKTTGACVRKGQHCVAPR